MSATDAMELMLEPMRAVCRRPSGIDETAALTIYASALAGYRRDTLRAGWEHIAAEVAGKFWPAVERLQSACRTVEAIASHHVEAQKPRWSDGQILGSDIGQVALSEGWGRDLLAFARKHHRRPTEEEAKGLRATSVHAAALVKQLHGQGTERSRQLAGFGDAMLSYEGELRSRYLDRRAA